MSIRLTEAMIREGATKESLKVQWQGLLPDAPEKTLSITYEGPDPVLSKQGNLSLTDVQPTLKLWGY